MKLPLPQKRLSPRRRSIKLSVFLSLSLVLGVFSLIYFSNPAQVLAQSGGIADDESATSNPKDREIQVTGQVVEFGTLEAVNLIEPPNNSRSRDRKPTFIWEDNATNSLAVEYLFYLDDLHLYTLPAGSSQTTNKYELYYDGGNRYSLTAHKAFADGVYSWKIVSKDVNGATISSATWNFIIDTKRPDFEINRINKQRVKISTGDASSIPTEPVEINSILLELKGKSSYQDYVEVIITFPDGSTREDSFTVAENGNWNRFFNGLPRDELMYFDFLIYDDLGNASRLDNLPIIVVSPTITIPIPGILVPPAAIPGDEPEIVIPITPPSEVVTATIISIISRIPPEITAPIMQQANYLNATLRVVTPSFWLMMQHWLIEWLLLIMLALLTLSQILSLVLLWRKYLNHDLFSSILMVVGVIPDGYHQGIAVDRSTQKPIRFGLITISGLKSNHQKFIVHRITNEHGIFFEVPVNKGKYRLTLQHDDYLFPCLEKRPTHLSSVQYYTGQSITVKDISLTLPMINIYASPRHVTNSKLHWKSIARNMAGLNKLSWPVWLLAVLITILLPTFGNLVTLGLFMLAWGWKTWQHRRVSLTGDVITGEKLPIATTIISLTMANGKPTEVTQSSLKGKYTLHTKQDQYHLEVTHLHFKVAHQDRKQALTAQVTADDHYHPIVMKPLKNTT